MIEPTVGRVIWVRNRPNVNKSQPEAGLIAYVHSNTMINVGGVDHNGQPFSHTSVPLFQGDEGETPPTTMYAEWMPFQKGQAAMQSGAKITSVPNAGVPKA